MAKRKKPGLLARLFGTRTTTIHLRAAPKPRGAKAPRYLGPATAKSKRKPTPRITTRKPGPYTQAEILAMMMKAGGHVKTVRKNPTGALEAARAMSRTFHGGAGRGHVVELSAAERKGGRSKYAVLIGEETATEYRTPSDSRRAGATWRHVAGDRGPGKPRSQHAPLKVADPRTGEVFTVKGKSPMRFSPKQGLVG